MKGELNHIFELELTTITPVSIGTGEILSDTIDYFIDNSNPTIPNVYYLDNKKFEKVLEEKNAIDSFSRKVVSPDFKIKNFVQNTLNTDFKQISKSVFYPIKCEIGFVKTNNRSEAKISTPNIYPIIKSGNKPYIAGSSIKGAISTAILYDWLMNDNEGKMALQNFDIFLEKEFQNLDVRLKVLFTDRKQYFTIASEAKNEKLKVAGKDDISYYKHKTKQHTSRTAMKRANEQLIELLKPTIEKIEKEFDRISQILFGDVENKESCSPMSLLRITDSNLTENSNIGVYDTKRYHLKDKKATISQVRETIDGHTKLNIRFVFDVVRNSKDQEYFISLLSQNPLKNLFQKINSFSLANIDYEIKEVQEERYKKFILQQKKSIENAKSQFGFLRVGAGKTYFSNSIGLAIYNCYPQTFQKLREILSLYPMQDKFPVTIAVTMDKFLPLGWIQLANKTAKNNSQNSDIITAKIDDVRLGIATYDDGSKFGGRAMLENIKEAKKNAQYQIGNSIKVVYQKSNKGRVTLIFKEFI